MLASSRILENSKVSFFVQPNPPALPTDPKPRANPECTARTRTRTKSMLSTRLAAAARLRTAFTRLSSSASSKAAVPAEAPQPVPAVVPQSPNHAATWSTNQRPRPAGQSGPRFEQTTMELQPNPLSAMELIANEPIQLIHGRKAICDGGKSTNANTARKVLIIEKLSFSLPLSIFFSFLFLQALDHLGIPRSTLIWYVLHACPKREIWGLLFTSTDRTNLALIRAGELASI